MSGRNGSGGGLLRCWWEEWLSRGLPLHHLTFGSRRMMSLIPNAIEDWLTVLSMRSIGALASSGAVRHRHLAPGLASCAAAN